MTDELDIKLNEYYAGKVVRKDLTKLIKEGANVPNYVLEYLLGMYCATDDEDDIENGTAMVKQILAENYVRPDEAEKIKAKIRERGQFKIIDKVSARLNEHNDTYEGQIFNLNIARIRIADDYIKMYEKLPDSLPEARADASHRHQRVHRGSPIFLEGGMDASIATQHGHGTHKPL